MRFPFPFAWPLLLAAWLIAAVARWRRGRGKKRLTRATGCG